MCKTISVFNQKGGVAKTTTVTNLGAALAINGNHVLIVDMDPQANATVSVGINDEDLETSIYDLLKLEEFKKGRILEGINKTSYDRLSIIPADISLSNAEINLSSVISRETILSRMLSEIKYDYDYILIDCPPSLGLLSVNALAASDYLIIPVSTAMFSIKGIKHLINSVNLVRKSINPRLEIMGVLITMYDKRKKISKDIRESLEEAFKGKVFESVIRVNAQIEYSQENRIPVIHFDDKCNAYEDYINLMIEVLNHEK